jgi:hypothetical protein
MPSKGASFITRGPLKKGLASDPRGELFREELPMLFRRRLSLVAAGLSLIAAGPVTTFAWDLQAGSPPAWQAYWVQTIERTQLFGAATDDIPVDQAAAHTFYRVDAPAQAGRLWVYNPLNSGWAWLPEASTSPTGEPSLEQVRATAGPQDPREYLYERAPDLAPRLDCIIARESGWDATARNPHSSAAGLGQFMPSTWAITPQGQLGLSPFDPLPSIDAAIWLAQTRGWTQWQVYTRGACRT